MLISSPSQIFLIVEIVVLLFLPEIILFKVDCVIPHIVASLLMVIPLTLHNSKILNFTAKPILNKITSWICDNIIVTFLSWKDYLKRVDKCYFVWYNNNYYWQK